MNEIEMAAIKDVEAEKTGFVQPSNVNDYGSTRDIDSLSGMSYSERMSRMCRGVSEVTAAVLPLGFIAFGGPQAHVALLHTSLVEKLEWVEDGTFVELLALGHALPGPTSSQMVVALAASKGGPLGALIAFVLWSLPAFVVLTIAGMGTSYVDISTVWYLKGLPPAAVALVFSAAYKIGNKTCKNSVTQCIALLSALAVVLCSAEDRIPIHFFDILYPALLVAGGITSACLLSNSEGLTQRGLDVGLSRWGGACLILIWAGIFVGLSMARFYFESTNILVLLAETFWRVGSVVFGGGQVVLPMMLTQIVGPGWLDSASFYSGMALTQASPGPFFNFAAFIGGAVDGIPGAVVSQLALFGPGVILILAVSPFWLKIRSHAKVQGALKGINAAAAGLIFAALIMLYQNTVTTGADAVVVMVTGCLGFGIPVKVEAPIAIGLGGIIGAVFAFYEVGSNSV